MADEKVIDLDRLSRFHSNLKSNGLPMNDWQANKKYKVGYVVIYNGNQYRCTVEHTSTSTFDTSKWELTSSSGGVDLPEWQPNTAYTAGKYLVHEGTVYKVDNDFTSGTTFSDTNLTSYIAPIMTGATSSTNGSSGLVPLPTTSDISKFLCGDGTWKSVGGSVAVARDILYTTTTPQSSGDVLALSKPYTDYDLLILYIGESNGGVASSVINPKAGDSSELVGYYRSSTNNYSASVSFTSSLSATISSIVTSGYGASNYLKRIEGIKFRPNPNNYSTTEQEIGTWIDGKPLYQRTLTGTCPSTTGSYVELTDLSSVGIASLTSIEGFVTDISGVDGNRNMWPICQSDAANSNKDISVILQMNQKLVMACKQSLSGQTYYITIKYTKV